MGMFDSMANLFSGGEEQDMPDPEDYRALIDEQARYNRLDSNTPFGSIRYTSEGPRPLSFEEWKAENPMEPTDAGRMEWQGGKGGDNVWVPNQTPADYRGEYDKYVGGLPPGRQSVGFEFSPEMQGLFDKQFSDDAYAGYEQDYMDRYRSLIDPYRAQETDQFQQGMFNRGVPEGSDVYGDAWRPVGDQRERGDIMAAQAATGQADQRMLTDYNRLMTAMGGSSIPYPQVDAMGPANLNMGLNMYNNDNQREDTRWFVNEVADAIESYFTMGTSSMGGGRNDGGSTNQGGSIWG